MSRKIQTAGYNQDKRRKAKRQLKLPQAAKAAPLQLPAQLAGDVSTGLRAQADTLRDSRLPVLQRQLLAREIGKTQGNSQLQHLMRQLDEEATSATVAQRGEGEGVETASLGGATHEVVAGDTLWGIAKATYGAGSYWRAIYRANPDKAQNGGNLILVGTILNLPVIDVPVASTAETVAPDGGDGEAIAPYGVSTEFGNFMIYPDEFVGPLPVGKRNAAEWPIRETEYNTLIDRLTAVKDGTSKFSITGTDAFQTHVYLDLGWLMSSAVGQELVQQLQDAAHTTTIIESTGGNSESAEKFSDGLETTDTPPKPGPGTNVTVKYNPNRLFIKDGSLDWHNRPPAIGLSHELIHAWADLYGMTSRGKDAAGTHNYELQAVGLGKFQEARLSENKFRAAFGLPLRPVY